MDESYFRDKLSAYFDKALSPEEMAMMDEYVRENAEARRILDDFRKFDAMVNQESELGDDEYWERSAQKIEQAVERADSNRVVEPLKSKSGSWIWKAVPIAASIMLLTFIGLHQGDIFKNDVPRIEAPQVGKEVSLPTPPQPRSDSMSVGKEDMKAVSDGSIETDVASEDMDYVEDKGRPEKATIGIPTPVADAPASDEVDNTAGGPAAETAGKPHVLQPPIRSKKRQLAPTSASDTEIAETKDEEPVKDLSLSISVPAVALEESVVADEESETIGDLDYLQPGDSVVEMLYDIAESEAVDSDSDYQPAPDDGDYNKPKMISRSDLLRPEAGKVALGLTTTRNRVEQPAYTEDQLDSLLDYYREVRGKLENELERKKTARGAGMSFKSTRSEATSKSTTSAVHSDLEKRRALYEAYYYIALTTSDEDEFVEVITVLEKTASNPADPLWKAANDYLKLWDQASERKDQTD